MATKQVRKPGRPAKKTRRTFAAGGVVRLAQGEKVPDAEEVMRQMGANQYGGAGLGPAPGQRTLADAVGDAAASPVKNITVPDEVRQGAASLGRALNSPDPFGARRMVGAAADYGQRALSAPAGRSGSGSGIGVANMQRGEAAPSGPGYRGPRAPVETYTGPVAEFFAGSAAPAPGVASRSSQGVPSRAMSPAPVPPPDARRPGGTIGRIGRGSAAAPTDVDFFTPAEAAPVASPGFAPPPGRALTDAIGGALGAVVPPAAAGAVPPAAPNSAYGTQDEILGAAKRGLKEQRAAGAVSPERVSAARQQAQFEERNIARDRGQGMVGGSLAGQRAMADNALLQKWYSMPENQRGRMPASVENAKYRGADDTETAFNVARARIMQTPMGPGRQAQALANLDKTRADMLNQSQQTRQTGEFQQGQLGNERERTGVARQQVEQTGQNQQAQMAHQQRMAQLALDQGYSQGLFTPDEPFNDEAAKNLDAGAAYVAAYERRRAAKADAKARWVERILAGETPEQIIKNPGADAEAFAVLLNPAAGMMPRKYAGGGMVSPQPPVYGGAPDAQRADPLINAYRIYTTQSKAMGAPTVPFAEFSSLYAGAAQGPMQPPVGMAGGGAVPAAGKMVVDTDPNARVDSIPAMIDGEQPAALNSGEFVFPTDVTSYYGTKMLSGMIEKARTGGKPSGRSAEAV